MVCLTSALGAPVSRTQIILMKFLLRFHLVLVSCQMNLPLFLPFEHSRSLLFFFSQIRSFTLHLKFLTIVTHLIYRILTILGTIIRNKILLKFKDTRNNFKKRNFSFLNRYH